MPISAREAAQTTEKELLERLRKETGHHTGEPVIVSNCGGCGSVERIKAATKRPTIKTVKVIKR